MRKKSHNSEGDHAFAWRAEQQRVDTYVWSTDGEVAVDGHHSQQTDTGHAKEDVECRIDLETKTQTCELLTRQAMIIVLLL